MTTNNWHDLEDICDAHEDGCGDQCETHCHRALDASSIASVGVAEMHLRLVQDLVVVQIASTDVVPLAILCRKKSVHFISVLISTQ